MFSHIWPWFLLYQISASVSLFSATTPRWNTSNSTTQKTAKLCCFAVQDTITVNRDILIATEPAKWGFLTYSVTAFVTLGSNTTLTSFETNTFLNVLTSTSTTTLSGPSPVRMPSNAALGPSQVVSSSFVSTDADIMHGDPTGLPTYYSLLYTTLKLITVPAVTDSNGLLACATPSTFSAGNLSTVFSNINSNAEAYFGATSQTGDQIILAPASTYFPTPKPSWSRKHVNLWFTTYEWCNDIASEAYGYIPQTIMNSAVGSHSQLASCLPAGPSVIGPPNNCITSIYVDSVGFINPEIINAGGSITDTTTSTILVTDTYQSDAFVTSKSSPKPNRPSSNIAHTTGATNPITSSTGTFLTAISEPPILSKISVMPTGTASPEIQDPHKTTPLSPLPININSIIGSEVTEILTNLESTLLLSKAAQTNTILTIQTGPAGPYVVFGTQTLHPGTNFATLSDGETLSLKILPSTTYLVLGTQTLALGQVVTADGAIFSLTTSAPISSVLVVGTRTLTPGEVITTNDETISFLLGGSSVVIVSGSKTTTANAGGVISSLGGSSTISATHTSRAGRNAMGLKSLKWCLVLVLIIHNWL
ncbi:hypothetical protein EG329_000279 [Mollisiaceae sp. DMI_Dod_QoI]|nr:hypothetical protein EG329_000279 [Helotiales sp. DMI_Dod_QoI]